MRLSSLADYAVITMCEAARQCGTLQRVSPDGARRGRTSAAVLAARAGLPVPTVQKIVSRLTAAGLLRSVRGAGGGLQLARPPAAITLAEIVEAVEGPIVLQPLADGTDVEGAARPHLAIINEALRGALAGISLDQLARTREVA